MCTKWFGIASLLIITIIIDVASGRDEILLDTRTALSDLGWTMSQGSEWQEMTSDDAQGNERRMHMVCQIMKPNQNNWLRTQYIPVRGAQRVYVEVEFTIRSCEDVPNVATCKETFNLYYYETDRDEATTTFPPWREGAYIKVDTIAADQRFRPGSADTNFETRDIGPLTKNGIYLAIQDTGACVALMHVRVYYKYCEQTISSMASFPRTVAGRELTSLEEAKGICVKNAITVGGISPILYCNGEGEWTVPSGMCTCAEGYEVHASGNKCTACAPGSFKSTVENTSCSRCPAFSSTREQASSACRCTFGYFRAVTDSFDLPCTTPPSKPVNLYSDVNQTSVGLFWEKPLSDGGRRELWYSAKCFNCEAAFVSCAPCSSRVKFSSKPDRISATEIRISGLRAYAFYKFQIIAQNDVSTVAASSGRSQNNVAVATVQTNQAAPSAVVDVRVTDVTSSSFLVTWNPPVSINGDLRHYEISALQTKSGNSFGSVGVHVNRTTNRQLKVTSLQPSMSYTVKVRARTQEGFGPYSAPVQVKTRDPPPITIDKGGNTSSQSEGMDVTQLLIAVGGGIFLILIIVVVIVICRRRARASKSTKMDVEKQPMFNGSNVSFSGSFPSTHKTYIDPTTYEDPNRAVREFTKEIDASCVKIEQVIGGGEFGEVCRGRLQPHNKNERDVAIKTLKSGYSTQQKLDFLGEASIMGQFDHPNVIRLEGVVTRSRPLMIITEFMENGSLDVFLRNHDTEFSVIQLVGMLRNIAAGMKYLSDMGYVHRDLAARNILVNAQLICKVSDFGMSRVLEEDSEAAYTTRGGKIPIRWTAPEAFTFRKFTSASDVWSYGIVMWEVMSYGERPYWGMSNRDVMNAVETGYRLPAPMDCPQVQHRLMLDCWKKDRNQRPKFGQIVSSLDKMLRDPSQLKIKADHERTRHAPLPNGRPSSTTNRPSTPSSNLPVARTVSSPVSTTVDSAYHDRSGEDIPEVPDTTPCLSNDPPSSSTTNGIDMSSLGAWLESAGLSKYKDNFTRNGCTSLEQVLQIAPSDLSRMGIEDVEDQDRLMETIRGTSQLQENDSNCLRAPDAALPTYNESQRLTGISV